MNLVDQAFIKAFSKSNSKSNVTTAPVGNSERKLRVDSSHNGRAWNASESGSDGDRWIPGAHFNTMPVEATPAESPWRRETLSVLQESLALDSDPADSDPEDSEPEDSEPEDSRAVQPPRVASRRSTEFRAAWEVDNFRWPEVCRDLLASHGGELAPSVEQIAVRCKSGDRILVVSGDQSGAGCTTVTLCLARKLTATGYSVAVIDTDAARPELADRLELDTSVSWLDVWRQRLALQEAAVRSVQDKLTLLPLSQSVQSGQLREFRHAAIEVMNELARHYDVVLVDAGSLQLDALGLFSAQHVSGINMLCVHDVRSANPMAVGQDEAVARSTLPIIGIAENFAA